MEIHAVKMPQKNAQQDTQNSPAKPHFDSVFLSISNIFSNETGSLRILVGFLFWNIFTLLPLLDQAANRFKSLQIIRKVRCVIRQMQRSA